MDDLIQRQAVLDLLEDTNNGWIINEVLQLPTVTPQEPKIVPIAVIKFDDDMLHEIVEEAVKNIEIEPKWISVSERLPEINEWVVCQCRANIYEVLKFTSYGWYHDDAHCYMNGFVIAWMPLPEPYKGEEE